MTLRRALLLLVVAVLATSGCQWGGGGRPSPSTLPGAAQRVLRGAGATFPAPIYRRWFAEFSRTQAGDGVRVDYQAVGSGGGIAAFTARQVDFGATDVPLNPEELGKAQAAGGPLVHIPTVLGAVVVAYNLPGARRLRMDAGLVAGLFLGQVRTWDDPRVAALNPSVRLPHLPVTVVHRSDSSGTTANFTTFVAYRDRAFRARIGQGKVVNWVTGTAAKGNDGVAAATRATAGAVGYMELTYAVAARLPVAQIKNNAGAFVTPTRRSVAAAALDMAPAGMANDFQGSLVYTSAKDAYPIASYTFLIVSVRQADADQGRALVALLRYMTGAGQAEASQLQYVPLPGFVRAYVTTKIGLLAGEDGRPLSDR
jgi:phosphate transport system substrate-binding protein